MTAPNVSKKKCFLKIKCTFILHRVTSLVIHLIWSSEFHFGATGLGTSDTRSLVCRSPLAQEKTPSLYADYVLFIQQLNNFPEIHPSKSHYAFNCWTDSKISYVSGVRHDVAPMEKLTASKIELFYIVEVGLGGQSIELNLGTVWTHYI